MRSLVRLFFFGLLAAAVAGLSTDAVVAAGECAEDIYLELPYPNDLDVVSEDGVDDGYKPFVGEIYPGDKRPAGAPKNSGLVWIPKEACGKKVDLLIAMHGWRSLSLPNVNIFVKSPDQKRFDAIVRSFLGYNKSLPIVIAAPLHDRGPKQTVWLEGVYNVNTHIKKINDALAQKGLNIQFSRVSLLGHSNANCGGGLARAAKELQGYPLYLYAAADGTCGTSTNNDFFAKYGVIEAVRQKGGAIFHLHQNDSDSQAASFLMNSTPGGLDPGANNKTDYDRTWKSQDGMILSYRLIPDPNDKEYNHTNAPQYLLKEALPRFFSPKGPYDPKANPVIPGSAQTGNQNPAAGASLLKDALRDGPLTENELQKLLQKPVLKIKIPGVNFSDITLKNLQRTELGGTVYLYFPFIGEYVAGVFRYLVAAIAIVSVVMIIVAGFTWILPSPSGDNINAAKKKIQQALVGLIVAMSSYSILFLINPELVNFRSLRVLYIPVMGEGSAEHSLQKNLDEQGGVAPYPCTGKMPPSEAVFGQPDFGRSEPYSCGNRNLYNVTYLVVHEGAIGDTIGYLTTVGLSTHFVIQRNGKVVQAVDIRRRAGHAGSIMNPWSVGVDLQIPQGCDQAGACVNNKSCSEKCFYTPEQYESLNQLIEVLIKKTGIMRNDNSIIAHCQIKYAESGHGDPRNFDWSRLGLNLNKHRQGDNMINGKCIKTFSVETHNKLAEQAKQQKKAVAAGTTGCCEYLGENSLPAFTPAKEVECLAKNAVIQWREQSCLET